MKIVCLFLFLLLVGCSSVRPPDSVGVSIEDLPGFGNPEIDECQITFGGEVPMVPCVVTATVEWEL